MKFTHTHVTLNKKKSYLLKYIYKHTLYSSLLKGEIEENIIAQPTRYRDIGVIDIS